MKKPSPIRNALRTGAVAGMSHSRSGTSRPEDIGRIPKPQSRMVHFPWTTKTSNINSLDGRNIGSLEKSPSPALWSSTIVTAYQTSCLAGSQMQSLTSGCPRWTLLGGNVFKNFLFCGGGFLSARTISLMIRPEISNLGSRTTVVISPAMGATLNMFMMPPLFMDSAQCSARLARNRYST